MTSERLTLHLQQGRMAVARLPGDDPIPGWFDVDRPFCALVRTADELSLVCAEDEVPDDVTAERGWRILSVAGRLDLGMTGVLAGLAVALGSAGVPIFALATFDTDHLLVREDRLDDAVEALRSAGYAVR